MAEEQGIINYDPATTNLLLDRMYRNRDSFPFDTEVKPESEKGITSGAVYKALNDLGGGGTDDYNELNNKPSINNVPLEGSKSLDDLGIQKKGDYATKDELKNATPSIGENGNWYIGGSDTGKSSKGADGVSLGEIALVQETGTGSGSEKRVISQKVVSEKLSELEKKLGNNDNADKILGKKGTAETILDTTINASTGEVISSAAWKSFSADVSGYGKIKCTVGFAGSDYNVGLAFYDGEDAYISGYYKLENRGYEKVMLVIPENAKTAKWSWLDNGDEPFKYDGEYELIPIPSLSSDLVLYKEKTLTEFNDNVSKVLEGLNSENINGTANLIDNYAVKYESGELMSSTTWKSFSANVLGYRKIKCKIGVTPTTNIGIAFYDNEDAYISGYGENNSAYYIDAELDIPKNAKTAKWSWLKAGNENQPFEYNGDYELIPKPAVSSRSVSYRNMTQEEFNMEVERNLDELSGFTGSINNIEGVVDHNTENLLDPDGTEKTFNDGVNSFSPPNEGYELSNRIDAAAGEWFTRTGTATGMIVVTDSEDKNGQRLTGEGGATLGNSFQIPREMSWVRYIRIAVQVAGAKDGSVVICRGKHAFTGEERGDYITVPSLRVEKRNLAKDVAYLSAPDGTYWELYIDGNHSLQIREVDPDVIPPSELPSNWDEIKVEGSFNGFFDRFNIMTKDFLIDMNQNGPVRVKPIVPSLTSEYDNFEHFYTPENKERYVVATNEDVAGTGSKYITIFDENFSIIDKNIGMTGNASGIDSHDFIYISDTHLILLNSMNANVNIGGAGMKNIRGATIQEIVKQNGEWKSVGWFAVTDYPQLCTDAFGEMGDAVDSHPNTIGLDYDGNLILNMRNWDTWIKIRRVDNGDGTYTLGSATKDYSEAVIGRVGGRHNSAYIDAKRVLGEGFSFTDIPSGLTEVSSDEWEEWQFFHPHDVKYWGMKEIGSKEYPTYTIFDNNYWTGNSYVPNAFNSENRRNNHGNNPQGGNYNYYNESLSSNAKYKERTVSRVVQMSIDWENKKVVDYKIYVLPQMYSKEQCGATMYDEGILSIAYSYNGMWGLWNFNEESEISGHVYKGAKMLFQAQYSKHRTCYRANTYKLK